MTLDRGILAKIDRRILSELDHSSGMQLAKIPLSDAQWSTWRCYCDVVADTFTISFRMSLTGKAPLQLLDRHEACAP